MRAFTQWLALAPLFVIAGCSTFQQTPRSTSSGSALPLSEADAKLGEALAHYSQGLISEATLGSSQSALSHYRQAAALDPTHIPLNLKVAADYIVRRDYTGAVSVLKSLERTQPKSVEIRLLLGSVYQTQGKSDEAVQQFRSVIRMAPEQPDAYIRLATLLAVERDSRKALAVVEEGLRHVKNPQPLFEFCESLGRLLVVGKDVPGAIRFFDKIPDNPQVAFWLGELHELQDDNKKAIAAYGRAGKAEAFKLLVALRMALLYMQLGQPVEALPHFDEVARRIEHDETLASRMPPLFYFWYGSACERGGRVEAGEKYLVRYLAANPDSAETLNYLAYMWAEQGANLEQAGAYIAKAMAQDPDNGAYLDTQGWIQYKQGDYVNALKNLERAWRQAGSDPTIKAHLRAVRAALKKR